MWTPRPTREECLAAPLASAIRSIRQDHSKSVTEFADLLGCPVNSLTNYQLGRMKPSAARLLRLLRLARSEEQVRRSGGAGWLGHLAGRPGRNVDRAGCARGGLINNMPVLTIFPIRPRLRSLDLATEADRAIVAKRLAAIDGLLAPKNYPLLWAQHGNRKMGVVRHLAALHNTSERTLRRWRRIYKDGGLLALVRKVRSDSGRPRRFDDAALDFLLGAIQRTECAHGTFSITKIYRAYNAERVWRIENAGRRLGVFEARKYQRYLDSNGCLTAQSHSGAQASRPFEDGYLKWAGSVVVMRVILRKTHLAAPEEIRAGIVDAGKGSKRAQLAATYLDFRMESGTGAKPSRLQACLRSILGELSAKALLILNDRRLEVMVIPDSGFRAWAYFPVRRGGPIAKALLPKPQTRVLLLLSAADFQKSNLETLGAFLRTEIGHCLLFCVPQGHATRARTR